MEKTPIWFNHFVVVNDELENLAFKTIKKGNDVFLKFFNEGDENIDYNEPEFVDKILVGKETENENGDEIVEKVEKKLHIKIAKNLIDEIEWKVEKDENGHSIINVNKK